VEENVPQNKRNQARALYPAARDTKAAIRWLYAQAETYKINTDYITAMGGSAGAALAIMTGVTDAQDYRDELTTELDETLASTHLDQSADIAAILDYWGSGVLVNTLNAVHGHQRYDVNDAPINIVHGTEDPTVLFSEAEALRDAYLSTGVDYAFHPLEGARHGPWGATIAGKNLRENGFDFITSQLELTVE
jgi:acetyl esterase/lipase